MLRRPVLPLLLLTVVLSAGRCICGSEGVYIELGDVGGGDGGVRDGSSTTDASVVTDAGRPLDAGGAPDASRRPDAGPDAGPSERYRACFLIAAIDRVIVEKSRPEQCTRLLASRGMGADPYDIDTPPRWHVRNATAVTGPVCGGGGNQETRATSGIGFIRWDDEVNGLPTHTSLDVTLTFPPDTGLAATETLDAESVPIDADCLDWEIDAGSCAPDEREPNNDREAELQTPPMYHLLNDEPVVLALMTSCVADVDYFHAYSDCCLEAGASVDWEPAAASLAVDLLYPDGGPLPLDGPRDVIERWPGHVRLMRSEHGGSFLVRVHNRGMTPARYQLTINAAVFGP